MKHPTERDVKKIGPVMRGLAAFLLFCSVLAGAGLVFAILTEPFELLMLAGMVVIGIMVHVSGSVVFTGYAPNYLLFTHGLK